MGRETLRRDEDRAWRRRRVRGSLPTRRPWLLRFVSLLALTAAAIPARAAEILAVLSSPIPPYERALQDFRTALARLPVAGPKAIHADAVRALVLSTEEPDALERALRERRPDLLLAVGRSALAAVTSIRHVPTLYLLAPAAEPLVSGRANVTGIEFDVPPRATLAALRDVLPGVRRLGLLFDPTHSGALLAEAEAAAEETGVALTAIPVHGPREVAARLGDLAGKVDALWLLPDLTVATAQGLESFVLFSQERRLPVLSFSPYQVKLGATLSVSADPAAAARQAARMARRLLAGEPPGRVATEPPAGVVVTINRAVATKIGVKLNVAEGHAVDWTE